MSTITRELAKLFRKITNSEIDAEGNAHVVLSPADSLLINNARIALASLETEASGRNPVLAYADSYRDMANQGVESIPVWSVITDLERNIAPLFTAPPAPVSVPDDYFSSLVAAARVRADKAMRKFPQPNYVLNKVAEESGEVIKAVIHFTEGREEWRNVEGEIIDNLAMLIRLVMEGDQVIGFTPPDACRAAMLQGAEPVTTAYKLPANTPCRDAPEHIWLQTAGVWPEDGEFSELTWCSDNQHQDDTLYVRADVVPGNSPVIPDGWVACSERMPENDDFVYIWPRPDFGVELHVAQYGKFDKRDAGWYAQVYEQNYGIEYYPVKVTHWMPLPAAPQQEVTQALAKGMERYGDAMQKLADSGD